MSVAGIALLILGAVLLVAEAHAPSYGVLAILGVLSVVAAAVVLADSGPDQTAWIAAAAGAGLVLAGFAVFAGGRAARARAAPPRSAVQDLVGATARVRTPLDPEGQVFVDGALWHARLDPEHQPQLGVPAGRTVRVDGVRGLTLIVHPEPEEAP